MQDPVTWYGINYAETQITQWDFQNKETLTSPARLSFVLKVTLLHYSQPAAGALFCKIIQKQEECDNRTELGPLLNLLQDATDLLKQKPYYI